MYVDLKDQKCLILDKEWFKHPCAYRHLWTTAFSYRNKVSSALKSFRTTKQNLGYNLTYAWKNMNAMHVELVCGFMLQTCYTKTTSILV